MAGEAGRIDGTTRHEQKFPLLEAAGIAPILFDGETPTPELLEKLVRSSHIVISISPNESGDPAVAVVEEALCRRDNTIRWIGYLSTVGVYGDHQGEWVNETTACKPVSRRSLERVKAEEAWTQLSKRHGTPLAILRLSGIYGPAAMPSSIWSAALPRIVNAGQVFNRIHVEDIAGACAFWLAQMRTAFSTSPTMNRRRRRMWWPMRPNSWVSRLPRQCL
ncbi:NAD-dependent epimerase/dehydratase family protein [Brucella sp. NF 2653]|uniref:NAD-dependent epimerase/dehydratase family protein n=1 Tax=Brucella sp. NF 2653 TaxID=693748 RepID=UPI003D0DA717